MYLIPAMRQMGPQAECARDRGWRWGLRCHHLRVQRDGTVIPSREKKPLRLLYARSPSLPALVPRFLARHALARPSHRHLLSSGTRSTSISTTRRHAILPLILPILDQRGCLDPRGSCYERLRRRGAPRSLVDRLPAAMSWNPKAGAAPPTGAMVFIAITGSKMPRP